MSRLMPHARFAAPGARTVSPVRRAPLGVSCAVSLHVQFSVTNIVETDREDTKDVGYFTQGQQHGGPHVR